MTSHRLGGKWLLVCLGEVLVLWDMKKKAGEQNLFAIKESALSQVKSKNSLQVIRTPDPSGSKMEMLRESLAAEVLKVRSGLWGFIVLYV